MSRLLILVLLVLPLSQTFAAKKPRDGKTDSRVKLVNYNPRDVVRIHAHYGYTTHIEFSEEETVEVISIGDSMAWQVSDAGNHLFLKPIENNPDTNMNVLTNKRVYYFELNAGKASSASDQSLTFTVRFQYPREEMRRRVAQIKKEEQKKKAEVIPDRRVSAMDWNMEYFMKGDTNQAPKRVMDDGTFTYFQFPKEVDLPAIFLVDEEGNESLLNHHVKGKYLVVEKIGKQFILRNGNRATCIFNKTFKARIEPSELPLEKTADAHGI